MAKADYLIALIKAHYSNESERFTTLALQIDSHEAKIGHTRVAREIKEVIDQAKITGHQKKSFSKELDGLIEMQHSVFQKSDIITSENIRSKIKRIIREFI